VYNWLLVHSKWSEKIPDLKVHILCPDGDWLPGTVVVLADGLAVRDERFDPTHDNI